MSPLVVFPYYLVWHYTRAIGDFFVIWGNLLWFVYNFFSISNLFKNLFSPFKRLTESGAKDALDVEGFFEALVVNTLMRIIGFVLRIFVIAIGLVVWILTLVLGLVAFLLWLVVPLLIAFFLISALIGLFNI